MKGPVEVDDPRLAFCKIEEHSIPPTGLIEHIKDHYWLCHPERGLVLWGVGPIKKLDWKPMCNKNEEISKMFLKHFPWAEVKLVPSFFRRINPRDYA